MWQEPGLNPGPLAPQSKSLTTRPLLHPTYMFTTFVENGNFGRKINKIMQIWLKLLCYSKNKIVRTQYIVNHILPYNNVRIWIFPKVLGWSRHHYISCVCYEPMGARENGCRCEQLCGPSWPLVLFGKICMLCSAWRTWL